MGAWSGAPFGNDSAADWAWELDGENGWDVVVDAFTAVLDKNPETVTADAASIAVAAAEVVAHQIGQPTQSDTYTESVTAFIQRASKPPAEIVELALTALNIASSPRGELAELWAEAGTNEWATATSCVREALSGSSAGAHPPAVLVAGSSPAPAPTVGSGVPTKTHTTDEQLTFGEDVKRAISGQPAALDANGRPAVQPWAVGPGRIIAIVVGALGFVLVFPLPPIGIALGLLGFILANTAWAHLRPGDKARRLTVIGQLLGGAAVVLGAITVVVGLLQS